MARLYSDEDFDRSAVEKLRELGHDALTAFEAGKANQGIPDEDVLSFAIDENRSVVTFNRLDFIRLHRENPDHAGIVVCTRNPNPEDLAAKIHTAVEAYGGLLANQLVRVYRGQQA